MLITSRRIMQPSFEAALEAALDGGARWIQLREKDVAQRDLMELAVQAQQLCARYGAMLSINARADIACAVHATGVHLPEHELAPREARGVLQAGAMVGQSVHSVQSAQRATNEGVDYLVFGSVFPTASHPGRAPQELNALREVTKATHLPVFAIGGIDASRIPSCLEAGAHGVAVLSAAWRVADVTEAVSILVQVVECAASA